ncbi:MAG TPA: S41 family peptidase [Flavobacterium sp.]|jgi:C-terminal processing protease CtpA/Prc
MKNNFKLLILLLLSLSIGIVSCSKDNDDALNVPSDLRIQDFIWKGLNLYYLWQADVPDLSDSKAENQEQLNQFLRTKSSPEVLFNDLLYKPSSRFPAGEAVDRFSVLVDDYIALENLFEGITLNNGVEFGLSYKPGSTTEIFGWVRYIIPNSDASTKDIRRGDIFYAINNTPLTVSNYQSLLQPANYTLNLADFNNGAITPNGRSVALTKTELTENPVLYTDVIDRGAAKVAYLVYNGFTASFDAQLNTAFATFRAAGATHLVLDLRYNSGGSVQSATRLASMITGQFNGQLFAKQQWNSKVEAFFERNNPGALINNFTNTLGNDVAINSLNLNTVYILTSRGSASASELVINGLEPYINVVQIGDVTTGKNTGSITLYDSPDFGKNNRNPNHRYAMQPLVIKTINKAGFGDYQNGLQPDYLLREDLGNLSQLGNPNELLLNRALSIITGSGRIMQRNNSVITEEFKNSKSMKRFGTEMYLEEAPIGVEFILDLQ